MSGDEPEPVWHLVFMGVSGAGKTTAMLAANTELGWPTAEGDDFHPQSNIDKMASGIPLTDDDRRPWLESLAEWAREHDDAGRSTMTSCSALRRSYRDILRRGGEHTFFVHLVADKEVLLDRMTHRAHFMPPSLLDSQLDTLEPLEDDEEGMVVDDDQPALEVAREVLDRLRLG